jgi:glucose-6-phosphate isomerase
MIDPLQQLSHYGQAYWIDTLTRSMIKSGELYMRVTSCWFHSIETFRGKATAVTTCATEIKEARFNHVVLLATGGLNRFPGVCRDTFGVAPEWPQFLVLDDIDPATLRTVEAGIDFARTLFIVASKSGITDAPLTLFRYICTSVSSHRWLAKRVSILSRSPILTYR